MEQDFSKKMVIIVRIDLPLWQVLNAVAHCSAYFGNKLPDNFDTGESFTSSDGIKHPRNTQYAIVTLSAKAGQMVGLIGKIRNANLLHIGFIKEMIETTDDAEIEQIIGQKEEKDIEYLGIGVFGGKEEVDSITGKLSVWKV